MLADGAYFAELGNPTSFQAVLDFASSEFETRAHTSSVVRRRSLTHHARIAKQVQALESLNADRIASGDPDVLEAGEELRLR